MRMAVFSMLQLGFGFSFRDLYSTAGLQRLDAVFGAWLGQADAALAARLASARADPDALGRKGESELLIALAPQLMQVPSPQLARAWSGVATAIGARMVITLSSDDAIAMSFDAARRAENELCSAGLT